MCALNRLTLVRSLFFAAGLVNQTKMLNSVRHVMKLFCQLDNCSSTYSYHKILVCYNSLFNPEMKRVNFLHGKECSLTCLLLWRGLAYITQDKWNKLAASENSGLLQYFTIIRQVFIMLCSGTTYVLPALKGNLVMTVSTYIVLQQRCQTWSTKLSNQIQLYTHWDNKSCLFYWTMFVGEIFPSERTRHQTLGPCQMGTAFSACGDILLRCVI